MLEALDKMLFTIKELSILKQKPMFLYHYCQSSHSVPLISKLTLCPGSVKAHFVYL
jgi:hypothetical protein